MPTKISGIRKRALSFPKDAKNVGLSANVGKEYKLRILQQEIGGEHMNSKKVNDKLARKIVNATKTAADVTVMDFSSSQRTAKTRSTIGMKMSDNG